MMKDVKQTRKAAWIFLIGFLVVAPALCFLSEGSRIILNVSSFVFLICGLGLIVCTLRLANTVCPQCREAFLRKGLRLSPYSHVCLHCGFSEKKR